jgi:cytochrome c-type biogenesis protein CcmH
LKGNNQVITFWLIAASLIVAIAVASLFVLPPLLRKIQRKPPVTPKSKVFELMGGRVAAVVLSIAIPVLAVMLYLNRPQIPLFTPAQPPVTPTGKMTPEHAQVVEDMAARLEQNPNDGKGWYMLGQSYALMGRFAESVMAYEKAVKLLPNDAQLLVDYADVMAVANDRNLRGKPLELIDKALKLDPDNIKGLALIGTAAFQAEDYASAVKYWEKLLKLLPKDSPFAKQMSSGVAEARSMIAGKKSPSFGTAQDQTQPVAGGGQIAGVLKLSPALANKAEPTDSVFLTAKDMAGAHAPIAAIRAQVKDLPLSFTLDDSNVMMPPMKLSDYEKVMISAKISKSGNTKTQRGDLIGEVASVKVGANSVQVVIDKIAP